MQLYRLENYSDCFDLYRDLVKNSQDDYEEERETNLASLLASLQTWGMQDVVCTVHCTFYVLLVNSAILADWSFEFTTRDLW